MSIAEATTKRVKRLDVVPEQSKDPAATGDTAATSVGTATLERLLERLKKKGDFPALGATLTSINKIVGTETEHTSVLSNAILKDVSMTSRLLKIVNAVAYRQFGGSITTITRAVDILGFNTVRNLALSLTLVDQLHDRTQAATMQEEVVSCYFSGLAARSLADKFGIRDAEEAFVCAMFRRLGRLLVHFFLREEALAIERLLENLAYDEARAAQEVLGLGFEEVGTAIAKAWNFPDTIIESMQPATDRPTSLPSSINQRTRLLAEVSNDLAEAARLTDEKARTARFGAIAHRYSAVGPNHQALTETIRETMTTLARDADALGIAKSKSALIFSAKSLQEAPTPKTPVASATGEPTKTSGPHAAPHAAPLDPSAIASNGGATQPASPEQTVRNAKLVAGIQDITNTLASDFKINEVLPVILDTFYRAIAFQRVLLFIVDASRQSMRCRFGFGRDADSFVKEGYSISLDGTRTVFHAAAGLGNDLSIEDVDAEKIRTYIPEWYRKRMRARGMLLLPITIATKRFGMIYADVDDPALLRFGTHELGLLKTLRNQAVLALRQAS